MFYILEKELKSKKITREQLANELGISISTISIKLNGGTQFTIEECKQIKSLLKFNGSIDELFRTE